MADEGVRFAVSSRKNKKYMATLPDGRKVHFGDSRYQQFRDSTPGGEFKHLDHGDSKRRENYLARHGREAQMYSPKWFSMTYLWS